MVPVALVEGMMGNRDRLQIRPEQGVEDIRSGDPSLGPDLRMQPSKDTHEANQLHVIGCLAQLFRRQTMEQAQILELGQQVVDCPIHGVQRINQGGMPVQQQDLRGRQFLGADINAVTQAGHS